MGEVDLSKEEFEKRLKLMKENCIFCKIVSGEIPSYKIFEDDLCIAFLDIRPQSKGQMVLVSKEHYMLMQIVPDNVLGHLSVISKYLCDLLKETFSYDRIITKISNGAAAGQQIQHFSIQIIPVIKENEEYFEIPEGNFSEEEFKLLTEKLKTRLLESRL